MDDVGAVQEADHGRAKVAAVALLSIAGAFVIGWGLIRMVDALEPGSGCGAYGYGGYGCPVDWKITVEPSTDLIDRQMVTVRGSGFSPNTTFGAAQCDPTVGPDAGTDACDLSTARTTTTDGDGDVQLDLQVRRIIIVQGREVDCALSPCTIGASTLSGSTPIEATSLPISFDPSVPPVPRLEVSLTVDDVSTSAATGTITCNRAADAFVEVAVHQSKGSSEATAYGFADSLACDVTPAPWTVRFTDGDGVLRGGLATYDAFASAYDGFDSADGQQSGEVRLAGGGGPSFDPVDNPGETVSVEVVDATSGTPGLVVNLLVDCDRAVPDGLAYVSVTQRVGLDVATGVGFAEFGPCDGPTAVAVPISAGQGNLAGGPAEVSAEVQIADFDDPAGEFFDYASSTAAVRLPGGRPTKPAPVVPNPSSRIVITGSTRSVLSGTVTCEEPAFVELFAEVRQTKGRTSSSGFGYSVISCSGTTAFEVPLDGGLASGSADSFVYATGYREIEGGDDYEYLWDDHQAATLRIGR